MHLSTPRLRPLTDAELTPAQAEALSPLATGGRPVLNIFRTLVRAPDALSAFLAWGGYILSKKNALGARERELVILRTGFLCGSGYEWTQHVAIGVRSGLTQREIDNIKTNDWQWPPADAALIAACDELHKEQFVSDRTWAALASHFTEKQCMDVVFTAGQYTQVSMMLNTFGVELDEGQTLDPDLDLR